MHTWIHFDDTLATEEFSISNFHPISHRSGRLERPLEAFVTITFTYAAVLNKGLSSKATDYNNIKRNGFYGYRIHISAA